MKKIVALFFCLMCALTACTQSETTAKAPSDAASDHADSSSTISGEEETGGAYTFHEIADDRITTVGMQKTFRDVGIAINVPADWRCMELNGEDGSLFSFRPPEWGEKCQFLFYVTGSGYFKERTEEEYLAYLTEADYEDVSTTSFAKEKVNGYEGTKVVFSYSSEDAQWIQTVFPGNGPAARTASIALSCNSTKRENLLSLRIRARLIPERFMNLNSDLTTDMVRLYIYCTGIWLSIVFVWVRYSVASGYLFRFRLVPQN